MSSISSSSRNNEPGAFDSDDEWELVNDSPLSSPLPGGSPVKVAFSPIRLGPASVPPVSPALTIPDDPNSTGSNDSFVNVSDNDSWGVSSVDSMDSTNSPRGGIAAIIARRVPPRRRAGALLPRLLRARAGAMVKGTVVPLETLRADAKAKSKAHPTVFGGKSGNPKPAMNRKGSKGATPKTAVRWHGPQGGRSMAQRGVAK